MFGAQTSRQQINKMSNKITVEIASTEKFNDKSATLRKKSTIDQDKLISDLD